MKKKLLFVITQFYKGGAEVALLNLLRSLPEDQYEIDFLIFDQMILKSSTSLIPQIPTWINVCNAAEKEGHVAIIFKAFAKIIRKLTKRQIYRPKAYQFIKAKEYDFAFSYGEWLSPEFVARKVKAKNKYVWIHTDIDKAKYVDASILLGYDNYYKGYIFVSEQSRLSAEKKFKQLRGKTLIVHNMCDDENIKRLAGEPVDDMLQYTKPILLTVGNIREEKNHERQIMVMEQLRKNNIDVTWLNVGSLSNVFLYNKLRQMVENLGLQDDFKFLGAKDNPYKYMKYVDYVMVLSDYESWSLVITEAKLLGVPVIATRTSGAKEQIVDQVTGILTDFDIDDISNKIEDMMVNHELRKSIQTNLSGFSTKSTTMQEFLELIKICEEKHI